MLFLVLPSTLLFITIAQAITLASNSSSPTTTLSSITPAPAPVSSAAASTSCSYDSYDDRNCGRPGAPIYPGYENPYDTVQYPYNIVPPDPSLASHCSSGWSTLWSDWLATAPITTDITPISTGVFAGHTITYDAETQISYDADWDYVATAPCCLNCTLFGGTVQVFAWPTPAPTPAVSALVNAAGFTFISPSVYVAFQSLEATDLCGNLGSVYTSTTIAFDESDLSTARAWTYDVTEQPGLPYLPNTFTQAEFGAIKTCGDVTSTFYQIDGGNPPFSNAAALSTYVGTNTAEYNDERVWTITYNPCSPTLSVPSQLFTLNPAWATCLQGIDAFYDPPYTLTTGNGLVAFGSVTTSPASATDDPSGGATPGSIPIPETASQTTQPDPTATPSPSNDPPANSPTQPSVDPAISSANIPTTPVAVDPATQSPSSDPPEASPTTADDPPANSPTDDPTSASPTAASVDPATQASASPNSPNKPSALAPSANTPAVVTLGSTTLTANSASAFAIASQTLTPGSQITHSGTVLSLASNGATLAIGGSSTQILATVMTPTSFLQIGTQSLAPGSAAITFSGSTYSLQADGSSIVVVGSSLTETIAVSSLFPNTAAKDYLIASSQTLVAGGAAITVFGTLVSLEADGSSVVLGGGTATIALSSYLGAETTLVAGGSSTEGLGGIIQSIGGYATSSTTQGATGTRYNETIFTGAGSRVGEGKDSRWLLFGVTLGVAVGVML